MQKKWCLLFSSFLLLTSCIYQAEKINIVYQPIVPPLTPLTLEIQPSVDVHVTDHRRHGKQHVSRKKDQHGFEMASIRIRNDFPGELANAIKTELSNLGFAIAKGDILVEIEIQKFYNDFVIGFIRDRATAELILGVTVRHANGNITYSRTLMGFGETEALWSHSGKNAKLTLEAALHDTIAKLFDDPAFLQALSPPSSSQEPASSVSS